MIFRLLHLNRKPEGRSNQYREGTFSRIIALFHGGLNHGNTDQKIITGSVPIVIRGGKQADIYRRKLTKTKDCQIESAQLLKTFLDCKL